MSDCKYGIGVIIDSTYVNCMTKVLGTTPSTTLLRS